MYIFLSAALERVTLGRTVHGGQQARGELALFCHSPCASLADPPKLPPAVRGSACVCGWELRGQAGVPPPPAIPPAPKCAAATRCAPSSARTRSRHGRRPPRSPPLRAAGAQPRAGHLRIHPGEANGPKRERAPLPGGRRVHLGSVCWAGRWCAMSCRHSPRGVGGWASGGSSLLVSRAAATVYMVPRAVFPILHCESSSGQPRGARTACVLLLAAGAERAFRLPTTLWHGWS